MTREQMKKGNELLARISNAEGIIKDMNRSITNAPGLFYLATSGNSGLRVPVSQEIVKLVIADKTVELQRLKEEFENL